MAENDELTYQDKYDLGYAKGYRIGSIESSRKIAIRCLKTAGKPSKRLIHKINHEVDRRILRNVIFSVLRQSVTVEMLEDIYDDLTPTKDQFGNDHNGDD